MRSRLNSKQQAVKTLQKGIVQLASNAGVVLRQTEKLDRVRVFEDALRFWIHLSHCRRGFWRREDGALEESNPELPFDHLVMKFGIESY